ncbi:MAG: TniQ family protein [Actinobacteria bacterium]|nr:TniQ family protein [Actinomycetota bacterium]
MLTDTTNSVPAINWGPAPIQLPPAPFETLQSWIFRCSTTLNVSPRDLLRGVTPNTDAAYNHYTLDTLAPTDAVDLLAWRLNVTTEQVRNVCTSNLMIRRVGWSTPADLRSATPSVRDLNINPWYTRACPACLANAPVFVWPWRLLPIEICPTHRLRLLDTCPGCGGRIRSGQNQHRFPTPASDSNLVTCGNVRDDETLCTYHLANAPAPAADRGDTAEHRWAMALWKRLPSRDPHVLSEWAELGTDKAGL